MVCFYNFNVIFILLDVYSSTPSHKYQQYGNSTFHQPKRDLDLKVHGMRNDAGHNLSPVQSPSYSPSLPTPQSFASLSPKQERPTHSSKVSWFFLDMLTKHWFNRRILQYFCRECVPHSKLPELCRGVIIICVALVP